MADSNAATVVVTISGGCVQSLSSTGNLPGNLQLIILDFDCDTDWPGVKIDGDNAQLITMPMEVDEAYCAKVVAAVAKHTDEELARDG